VEKKISNVSVGQATGALETAAGKLANCRSDVLDIRSDETRVVLDE